MEEKEKVDVGDEQQYKKRRTKAQSKRDQELYELRDLLQDKTFRRLMWRMLENCGVYTSSFTSDTHLTAFNEGERNIGLWLLSEIEQAAKEAYPLMRMENSKHGG